MNENVIDWREEQNIFAYAKCMYIECSYLVDGPDSCNTPCIGVNVEVVEGNKRFTALVNLLKEMPDGK